MAIPDVVLADRSGSAAHRPVRNGESAGAPNALPLTPPVVSAISRLPRLIRWATPMLAAVLAGTAAWVLRRELAEVPYRNVAAFLNGLPAHHMVWAALLTAACYLSMVAYDLLALRYVRARVGVHKAALASFISYAFSQNFGFGVLTGASIRVRFWTAWGLSAEAIAQGVAFTTTTFWLGVLLVGGATLLVDPLSGAALPWLPFADSRAFGALFLAPPAAYAWWVLRGRGAFRVRGWAFRPPHIRLALGQAIVATVDWSLAGAVLFVLLPTAPHLSLARLLGIFVLAQLAGLASHVPGGVGVFEAVIVLLLRPFVPAPEALAALLAYRVVYYLAPFALALAAFAAYEVAVRRGVVARALAAVGRLAGAAAPWWLSIATFIGGTILLVSGTTPSVHSRMRFLDDLLPLGVVEVSHLVASVTGACLLLLSNGLRRRLDAAYHLTVVALGVGVVASLLKGFDWEEALALSLVLASLVPARRYFPRRAALLAEPLTPGWSLAVLGVVAGASWIGLFAYQHVEYSSSLLWQFAVTADAPRFLRATVAAAAVLLWYATSRLLRSARPEPVLPTAEDLARAHDIVRSRGRSESNIALLGDKPLLFSASGRSFIAYGVAGRSWVAVGDPVGDPEEFSELAWSFRELADRHGARPVFYEVGREHLPLYIELGLTLLKLGEEAHVQLAAFSLEGGSRKGLRRTVKEVEKAGARFEVVPPERVAQLMPVLRGISDAWLAEKRTREKRFSLGFFNEAYLARFPAALVWVEGRLVAFANVWGSDTRQELSVDLMRFLPDAPRSTMEYLFIQLMLWARASGYATFNLGMAPLSGIESRPLAPVWSRVGALVFRQGEHFYRFRGLRQYKEKFDPVWEPRYLACPAGFALPGTLAAVASLIGGGARGVVAR